ncbi:MAG TPA: cyclic nucleotide-binding domain-containing protein [Pseudomonadales bacterium]|nr:cyclic nucleotide-binding domain-containing protein [Pseudomonadales bacterium]
MTTATVSLSRFIQLGINANTIQPYKPFSELSDKYRKQVVFASDIVEFAKAETVLKGQIDRHCYYYLLKGKLSFKTGLLLKKTISSDDDTCLFDIGRLLPDSVDIVAADAGHMLVVKADLMDAALAWTQANDAASASGTNSRVASSKAEQPMAMEEEGDEDSDWMSALLAYPLFFNLPPANISRVLSLFEKIDVKKGEAVIKQGDEGNYFYALIKGKAQVITDNQTDKPTAILSSGSYFGEDALVSGAPRSASVIMNTDGEVGRLDRESFQSLLQDPVVKYISQEDVGKNLMKRGVRCVLIDVRSREEFKHSPSPNSRNIPYRELRETISTLDKESSYFISPEGGKRSELAAHLMSQANLQAFVIQNS